MLGLSCGLWDLRWCMQVLEHVGSVIVTHRFSCPVACGTFVSQVAIELRSPELECGFLTTGPPLLGKYQSKPFQSFVYTIQWHLVHLQCCVPSSLFNSSTYHHPKKKPLYPLSNHCLLHFLPNPWWPVFSVSIDLPILDISFKWNHILCDLMCPGFST